LSVCLRDARHVPPHMQDDRGHRQREQLIVSKAREKGAGAFRRREAVEGGVASNNVWVSLLHALLDRSLWACPLYCRKFYFWDDFPEKRSAKRL
jgi:hypothetical protein